MIDGIDVSAHQTTTPALAGYSFLFARATYGTDRDARAVKHLSAARAAGLVTGLYHFGRHGDLEGQIAAFGQAIDELGPVDLIALDLERDGSLPAMTDLEAAAFLARFHGCGLYASTSRYAELGQAWRWVADYRAIASPPIPWDVWQWTSSAVGIHLDRNRFRGTVDELRALARKGDMRTEITLLPWGGTLTIAAGSTPSGIRLGPTGDVVERKTWTAADRPSSAPYDALVSTDAVTGNPFLRVTDGFFAGLLVSSGQVGWHANPAPATDCSDAVRLEHDRVVAAGKDALDRV